MIIYFLIALSPLVISLFYPKLNIDNKRKRNYLIICGIILVLFMGLRSKFVGSLDSYNYYNMMERALYHQKWSTYFNPNYVESGFQFFVFVLSRVFHSSQFLFIVTSAFYVVTILWFIYKNSDNVILSTVMYITLGLLQFHMQGMRQAVAMSICLIAYEFAKKDKLLLFGISIFIAIQMHRTAVVFALVYIISKLSYRMRNIILVLFAAVMMFVFSGEITDFANDIFDANYAHSVDSGGFIATAIHILIIVFAAIYNKDLREDKRSATLFYVSLVSAACYLFRYSGTLAAERISYYFMFAEMALLPNSLKKLQPAWRNLITYVVYGLCIALFLYRLNGSDFIPYTAFWSHL